MTTIDTHITSASSSSEVRASLGNLAKSALDGFSAMIITLMDWHDRARERRQLLGLSDLALKDFGASRAEAESEGDKPFWRS